MKGNQPIDRIEALEEIVCRILGVKSMADALRVTREELIGGIMQGHTIDPVPEGEDDSTAVSVEALPLPEPVKDETISGGKKKGKS